MLQSALEERFQLKVSHESQELPVYALVVAKGGPKLTPTTLPPVDPEQQGAANDHTRVNGNAAAGNSRIEDAGIWAIDRDRATHRRHSCGYSTRELGGQIVLDQTGLKGEYDFTLKWTPDSRVSDEHRRQRPGLRNSASARSFRDLDFHCAPRTTRTETGGKKGAGGCSCD